jgi:ABC-type multidrug transport system fused ATPase/permease subunit
MYKYLNTHDLSLTILCRYFFPLFLIPAFFIGMLYRQLAIGYLNTGRDLRRMESNSRSPIFSGFGEMLEGLVTVRAFSAERQFLDGLHSEWFSLARRLINIKSGL